LTAAARANFGRGSYFYFDIYMTAAGEQISTRLWNSLANKMYGGTGAGNTAEVKYFNANGEEITEGNLSTLNGQWITVRVKINTDMHAYDGINFAAVPTGRVFLRNIWMSNTADLYTAY
jgi:hypothetical protein